MTPHQFDALMQIIEIMAAVIVGSVLIIAFSTLCAVLMTVAIAEIKRLCK